MMNPLNTIKIKCIEITQPIGTFYLGRMSADEIVKITYTDVRRLNNSDGKRDVEIFSGIQRDLSERRVKEITKYVNTVDATFPSGIILHIEQKDIIKYDPINGEIIVPFDENVAKILDGQHRVAGLENIANGIEFQVAVTIFVGMELEDQAIVFSTLNYTQTKVNKSLVQDLFEFATKRSPQKTAHIIVRALNQMEGSPFYNKIKILGTAIDTEKETITQATFADALIKLYSKDFVLDRDLYKRGKRPPLFEGKELLSRPLRNLFIEEKEAIITDIIWEYFAAVQQRWPDSWNKVQNERILNKSTGFIALMNLFKDLYVHLDRIGSVISKEEYLEFFNKVNLNEYDFNKTRFIPGTGGQSQLYKTLKEQVGL